MGSECCHTDDTGISNKHPAYESMEKTEQFRPYIKQVKICKGGSEKKVGTHGICQLIAEDVKFQLEFLNVTLYICNLKHYASPHISEPPEHQEESIA